MAVNATKIANAIEGFAFAFALAFVVNGALCKVLLQGCTTVFAGATRHTAAHAFFHHIVICAFVKLAHGSIYVELSAFACCMGIKFPFFMNFLIIRHS